MSGVLGQLGSQLPLLLATLSASLLGSLHCVGMCGPFVAFFSGASVLGRASSEVKESRGAHWAPHVAYHMGRAITYVSLGALGGSVGAAVNWAGRAAGLVQVAAFGSSLIVVLWGVSVLFPRFQIRSPLDRLLKRQLIQLGTKRREFRASLLGVLTPLLPCGWLYAFVVAAAGTGSALLGATLMAVFWAGTVPALLGAGTIFMSLGQLLRERLPVVTGVALIVVGLCGVVWRAQLPVPSAHLSGPTTQSTPSRASEQVPSCH